MPPAAPTGPLAAAPLTVGIVGCGTAGPGAAALLARAGHSVTILERAAALGPAGAGILLQPTGMAVLDRLGVLPRLLAGGARISHLRGETTRGRVVLDLAYADLRPDLFGLGVQRGLLFTALLDAARSAGAAIRTGVQAVRIDRDAAGRPSVLDAAGASHGPYDLVLVADGARSALRSACAIARRDRVYPYGAAWVVARDPDNTFAGVLWQAYSGASRMLGVLPTGRLNPDDPADVPSVSLFWSLRLDESDALRAAGPAAFRRRLLDLAPRVAPIAAQIDSMDQVVVAAYNDVLCRSPIDARRGGAVVFLGDAAHAMSPQLGQGANLALADALVLADTLAAAGSAGHTLTRALRRYARLRRGPIGYYALASRWLTPIFQSGLDTLAPLRDLIFGPLCRFPPARSQMLRALAGVKTGVFTSRPLP